MGEKLDPEAKRLRNVSPGELADAEGAEGEISNAHFFQIAPNKDQNGRKAGSRSQAVAQRLARRIGRCRGRRTAAPSLSGGGLQHRKAVFDDLRGIKSMKAPILAAGRWREE
jgi:hypothetical protein